MPSAPALIVLGRRMPLQPQQHPMHLGAGRGARLRARDARDVRFGLAGAAEEIRWQIGDLSLQILDLEMRVALGRCHPGVAK